MSTKKKVSASKSAKSATTPVQFDGIPFATDVGTILHVTKKGRDALVVRLSEYKGRKSLDIRTFYAKDDGTSEEVWAPGKGISIPAKMVKEVIASIVGTAGRAAIAQMLEDSK